MAIYDPKQNSYTKAEFDKVWAENAKLKKFQHTLLVGVSTQEFDRIVKGTMDFTALETENAKLRERIEKMTVNGLSPESRLNGYSVIADKQVERIKELCTENANLRDEKSTAYMAYNRTSTVFFEDRGDAEKYAGQGGAASGIQVTEIAIIPKQVLKGESDG